ncbi:hypothetical protein B0G69_6675 [Paraburkholderia sp. RAU2J]|nr:hypothetical protein B0G69_6675 [Paraburkholderia sp. RAU2J]
MADGSADTMLRYGHARNEASFESEPVCRFRTQTVEPATRQRVETDALPRDLRDFRLCGSREALDPILVIAIEPTGMLPSEHIQKPGTLLRLFR